MRRKSGYCELSSMMGAHPEVAVFRRFESLSARNILHMQAELTSLELNLKRCVKTDIDSGNRDLNIYDRDWQTLSESAQAVDGNPEQLFTILRIKEKLKEYSKQND